MADRYDIPKGQEQAVNTGRMVIRTVAGGAARAVVYKGNIPDVTQDEGIYPSSFGTPVMSNFETKAGSYTINGETISYPALKFDVVTFIIGFSKNIVITDIQGGDSVIEYISNKNRLITIKGKITSTNGVFPLQQYKDLIAVKDAPVSIEVNSWYLREAGIYNIVITDAEIPQEPGRYSEVPFTLMALSDKPVQLRLK
jgi:hypothetical protein